MELLAPAANRVEVRRRKIRKNLGMSMRKWRRRMSKLSSLVPLVVTSIGRNWASLETWEFAETRENMGACLRWQL